MCSAGSLKAAKSLWSIPWRGVVAILAASSIWCLLAEFYGLCSMRTFSLCVTLPATLLVGLLAVWDCLQGDGRLWRAVLIGTISGLAAAVAYDIFRLPFVLSKTLGLQHVIPPMPLYKVFPRFGAMLLGKPTEQPSFTWLEQVLGWTYHFSNGLTFGIMYLAIIGNPTRHHWSWGLVMAAGIELGLLLTPYSQTFGIAVTPRYVVVTLAAHLLFGAVMGLLALRLTIATRSVRSDGSTQASLLKA